jgi:hypothetical protein
MLNKFAVDKKNEKAKSHIYTSKAMYGHHQEFAPITYRRWWWWWWRCI